MVGGLAMDNARKIATEGMVLAESSQPQEWPPIIALEAPNLPRLSVDALPKWAREYALKLSEHTETPLELTIANVLAVCSAAAIRRFMIQVRDGYNEPLNLWFAPVLSPGNRKSSAQASAVAPLLSWERLQAKKLEPEITRIASEIKTLEARVKELRNKASKAKNAQDTKDFSTQAAELEVSIPILPKIPQLWTSDATPERLGTLLSDNNECMAWLSSEGGVFELFGGRYSGGIPNLDLVLKTHSGDSERVDRGSRPPVFLRHPLLTIGISPQPDVLRGLANKPGFRGRGLLGRFLYLLPQSPLGYRTLESKPIPQNVEANYHSGIYAILDTPVAKDENGDDTHYVLSLSAEAYSLWHNYAKQIEQAMRPYGYFENATDWAGKAPGATARMAGILHVIENAHNHPHLTSITPQTMQCALHLISVISQHSMYAFEIMGSDLALNDGRKLWQWIERGRRAQFTVRDAHQALKSTFPRVKEVHDALDVLVERGYVAVNIVAPNAAGRPASPNVQVNPHIVQRWA